MTTVILQPTLADRLRSGDETAIADIVAEHADLVAAVVWRTWRGIEQDELEDITAEVVAECWRRRLEFVESRGSLPAWLAMIAKYRTLDHLRSFRRRAALLNRLSVLYPRGATVLPDYGTDLDAVLATLDPRQRTIVYMRYVAEEPVSQIAVAMRMTEKAVSRRLDRARAQLRVALARDAEGDAR